MVLYETMSTKACKLCSFDKLILARSNMAEGMKQYVHFSLLGGPESPQKKEKLYVH